MSMAKRFRQKPIEVEAVLIGDLIRAATREWSALPEWVKSAYERGDLVFGAHHIDIYFHDLNYSLRGSRVDWLIRSANGILTVVKCSRFDVVFEPAE